MKFGKKAAAGFLAAVLTVSGLSGLTVVKAAVPDAVEYKNDIQMGAYWTADTGSRKAPEREGYVFGGWYTKDGDDYTALKEADLTEADKDAYAKWVPAQILSIKAQLDATTNEKGAARENAASMRLVSSVDCTDYQKVGFSVLLANKNSLGTLETTRIYSGLKLKPDDSDDLVIKPAKIFGEAAQYFSVWRLDNIAKTNDAKIINVTPYWYTADGTKVEGLPKYVHVEDGYMGYISVPVSLRSSDQIAAGMLSVQYPDGLTLLEDKTEYGIFQDGEQEFNNDTANHTVRFVCNAAVVNENKSASGIYVNLRFQATDTSEYKGVGNGKMLDFTVNDENFCDWAEKEIEIDAWDVRY